MWSPKVNFLDILITSPQYFYKKNMGQDRRICSLILGVKGLTDRIRHLYLYRETLSGNKATSINSPCRRKKYETKSYIIYIKLKY